jgi:glycosyltransferase involved in cell wall biosynthesis
MRVAINAQLINFSQSAQNSGISRYVAMLLESLGRLGGDSATNQQRYTAFINARDAKAAQMGPLGSLSAIELTPSRHSIDNPVQRVFWEQTALPRELRRVRADVFHSPVNILPRAISCASVVTVHDLAFVHYPEYFRPTRRYYQRLLTRRSARQATRIVAVSESTKRDLVAWAGVPAERIEVIYTALAPDFTPIRDPHALAAFRAKHNLPERYLLYLGTIEPRKNLLTLLEAYAQLRSADPDAPPLMLAGGKGWYYEPVLEKVRLLGLERAITFVGYVSREEQPLWYSGSAAFVYPSLYEGFGLPVLEALACGTPTVTTNVSSLPEAAGSVALTVSPRQSGELAAALRAVLDDGVLRERMAAEGPRWAAQFTPERMARGYAAAYQRAAEAYDDRRNGRRVADGY